MTSLNITGVNFDGSSVHIYDRNLCPKDSSLCCPSTTSYENQSDICFLENQDFERPSLSNVFQGLFILNGSNAQIYLNRINFKNFYAIYNYNALIYDENQNSSISLHVKDYNLFPLDITDWKKLYQLDSSLYNSENNTNENIQASLNKEKNIIEFFKKDTKIYELNFSELSENFYQKYKTLGSSELSKEDMTFEVNNKTWNFVLYIRSINIKNPEYNWDNSYYFNLDWMILEK